MSIYIVPLRNYLSTTLAMFVILMNNILKKVSLHYTNNAILHQQLIATLLLYYYRMNNLSCYLIMATKFT